MHEKVDPAFNNFARSCIHQYFKISQSLSFKRTLARHISELDADDASIYQDNFRAAFTSGVLAMHMNWLVLIRVKIN